MRKEKEFYQKPDLSATCLFAESIVCNSNLGTLIIATEEEEDSEAWPAIN